MISRFTLAVALIAPSVAFAGPPAGSAAVAPPGQKTVFTGCGAAPVAAKASEPAVTAEPPVGISRDTPPAFPPSLDAPGPVSVTVTVRNRGEATPKTHLEVSFCRFGTTCRSVGAKVRGSGGVWPIGRGEERVAIVDSKGPLQPGTWLIHVSLVENSTVLDRWTGRVHVGKADLVLEGVRTPAGGRAANYPVPWGGGPVTLDVLVGNRGDAPAQVQVAFALSSLLGTTSCVSEVYAAPVEIPAGATRVPVAVTWQPPLGGEKSATVRIFDYDGQEKGVSVANRFVLAPVPGARVQPAPEGRCWEPQGPWAR